MKLNCLPFLGHENKKSERWEAFSCRSTCDASTTGCSGAGRRAVRPALRLQIGRSEAWDLGQGREKMAADVPSRRKGWPAEHGEDAREIRLRDEGRGGGRRGRRRHAQARGDEALRDSEPLAARQLVPPLPRGRRRGPSGPSPRAGPRLGREGRAENPRAGARGASKLEAQVAYLKNR